MDELDSEGKFESDDEIGTTFEGIQDDVNDLTTITDGDIMYRRKKKGSPRYYFNQGTEDVIIHPIRKQDLL